MSRFLAGYVNAVEKLSEFTGKIAQLLVIIVVAVGFFNVAVRYIGRFGGVQLSSNIFIETQWYLYSLVFFFGFNYILKNGINVRVDFLFANWPRTRQAAIDFLGQPALYGSLLLDRDLGYHQPGTDIMGAAAQGRLGTVGGFT